MFRLVILVAVVWLALMPPFFTDGACTAEFDSESARLEADAKSIATTELAAAYWSTRQVPYSVLSADQCRRVKPRDLDFCGSGPLIRAAVPVANRVCRIYRDDAIKVQLQYDDRRRLERIVTDMNPYKSLRLPFAGLAVHWAR